MSVRWSGLFKAELSEIYTFFILADNGARIYVDGNLSVDSWEVDAGGEDIFMSFSLITTF